MTRAGTCFHRQRVSPLLHTHTTALGTIQVSPTRSASPKRLHTISAAHSHQTNCTTFVRDTTVLLKIWAYRNSIPGPINVYNISKVGFK